MKKFVKAIIVAAAVSAIQVAAEAIQTANVKKTSKPIHRRKTRKP